MTEIEKIFIQDDDTFTVFVVSQKFVVGKGHEYFHSYINTPNYLASDEQIKKTFFKAVKAIGENIAPVSKLVQFFLSPFSTVSIPDAITALCKIFTVHEHQAAGPHVIDPIILQEGKITQKTINQLINFNKDSILQPTIIILLKDDSFERAKELLSDCPNGINIRYVNAGGETEIYKVINCGAQDIDSFIDSFSRQCYSTCSKTKREILYNDEWNNDSVVMKYSPLLMKFRTDLLFDHKEEIKNDLAVLSNKITNIHSDNSSPEKLLRSFECVIKLFLIFCNDSGGTEITDVYKLASELNNEVLLAQAYKYAEFLPNTSKSERENLYNTGYHLFKKNKMLDHAIYCRNNMLVEQFYSNSIDPELFRELQVEAINNVPGMVGLSHIFNNVGIAYLYCGRPEMAIDYFDKGLGYAMHQDRIVQHLALETNKMIAERYSFAFVDENRIRLIMRKIFAGMGIHKLPFLSADFVLNVLAVAYSQNIKLGKELIAAFPVKKLIEQSFISNIMGSGERCLQMQYLASKYSEAFSLLNNCSIPKVLSKPSGKKMDFILNYGYNPFEFNTWL